MYEKIDIRCIEDKRIRDRNIEYFKKLIQKSKYIRDQFVKTDNLRRGYEKKATFQYRYLAEDVLDEAKYIPIPGIIHKYRSRVLIMLTERCFANCTFCFRKHTKDRFKDLTQNELNNILSYLKSHKEVHEIIFSGGEPFLKPDDIMYILNRTESKEYCHIYDIRIHTRLPIVAPFYFDCHIYDNILRTSKLQYIVLHINHSDELTPKLQRVVNYFRSHNINVMSQTVLLRGINDNIRALTDLFYNLVKIGIIPYYLHITDSVKGIESFFVSFKKARYLYTQLQHSLPGIAIPKLVIDTPGGIGKILIPTLDWQLKECSFTDFQGEEKRVNGEDHLL